MPDDETQERREDSDLVRKAEAQLSEADVSVARAVGRALETGKLDGRDGMAYQRELTVVYTVREAGAGGRT